MDSKPEHSLLARLIEIPSISADPAYHGDILRIATLIREELKKLKFQVTFVQDSDSSPPLIIAKYKAGKDCETYGIYAHYDVQPANEEGWNTRPFSLTVTEGKMYGRGVADDKGHIAALLAGIARAQAEGGIQKNLVLVIEGEEESRGTHIETLLHASQDSELSGIDGWYVLDVGARSKECGQIFSGLRGIVTARLTVKTADSDVHSGIYGNRVYNPAQILSTILAGMKDYKTGIVKVPGFYEDILYPSLEHYQSLLFGASPLSRERTHSDLSLPQEVSYPGAPYNIAKEVASKILPSFEVNGLHSGYTDAGFKTIIPAVAWANISFRTAAGQDSHKIANLVATYLQRELDGIPYTFYIADVAQPFFIDIQSTFVQKARNLLLTVFSEGVLVNMSGGSIPAAEILLRLYKKPIVITGFTLPGENLHAANENMSIDMFEKAIRFVKLLLTDRE